MLNRRLSLSEICLFLKPERALNGLKVFERKGSQTFFYAEEQVRSLLELARTWISSGLKPFRAEPRTSLYR